MGKNPFYLSYKKKNTFTPDYKFYRIPKDLPEHKQEAVTYFI